MKTFPSDLRIQELEPIQIDLIYEFAMEVTDEDLRYSYRSTKSKKADISADDLRDIGYGEAEIERILNE